MSVRASTPKRAPTVCVVVPTLDESAWVAPLLSRLQRSPQDRDRADRVVVVDGGSRDATVELARTLGAEVRTAPRGRGSQLAAGAIGAREDVLFFLHADCMPEVGALAAVRAAFEDTGLAACGMRQRIDAEGRFYRLVERAANARVRRLGLVYGDSGLCVRRVAYEAVGGFRPQPLFEDVDLSRRLRGASRPRLIESAVLRVSPRRWQREGPLRATFRNWILQVRYAAGADPERLARRYAPHPPESGHPRGTQ